jgi:hypothetical protein
MSELIYLLQFEPRNMSLFDVGKSADQDGRAVQRQFQRVNSR